MSILVGSPEADPNRIFLLFLVTYLHRTYKIIWGHFSSMQLNWILPLSLQIAWKGEWAYKSTTESALSLRTPG